MILKAVLTDGPTLSLIEAPIGSVLALLEILHLEITATMQLYYALTIIMVTIIDHILQVEL